jgi:Choline dehydrogenase and related flavoproteins
MLFDFTTQLPTDSSQFDVCIFGSGPAGITGPERRFDKFRLRCSSSSRQIARIASCCRSKPIPFGQRSSKSSGAGMSWTCGASGRRNRFLARNWHRQVSALSSPCRKLSAPRPRRFCSPHHFLGTTRMHDNPRNGVVDADCRIHGVPNLFIAGGSVFPTGGCANPTLTIVALALRLAAHLHSELQSAPRIFLNPVPTQGAKTTVTPDGIEGPVSSVEIRNLHGTNPAGPASRTFNAGHNDADRPFATESG